MLISKRKLFAKLLDNMKKENVLAVKKLARLERDAVDVNITVKKLEEMEIKVYCIILEKIDLTCSEKR